MSTVILWACVALALGLVLSKSRVLYRWQRQMRIAAVVLVVVGLTIMVVDAAGASTPRHNTAAVRTENRGVQCVAGGLGVAGAWMGTLGSAPTTAGIVTAGAVTATAGATMAWYDMCPEYAKATLAFINPFNYVVWSNITVGKWFFSAFSSGRAYQPSGKFCVVRPGQSTKRCFVWRNLTRAQMQRAFRQWLSMYNIPARLYTGSLAIAS